MLGRGAFTVWANYGSELWKVVFEKAKLCALRNLTYYFR